jgi:hypothetical protein
MLKISIIRDYVSIAAAMVLLLCCTAWAIDGKSGSALRVYTAETALNRKIHSHPLIVEYCADRFLSKVFVGTMSENEFRDMLKRAATTQPAHADFPFRMIVTYENLSSEQRSFMVQDVTLPRFIDLAKDTLVKFSIHGGPLMPGDVRLKAYLLEKDVIVEESRSLTLKCVEE